MANKHAKILNDRQLQRVLAYIDVQSRVPESDHVKIALSYRAGLRASEIANLPVRAVTTADGSIAKTITVFANVAKNGRTREIPMHPQVAAAIRAFRRTYPTAEFFAIGGSGRYQSANTVTVWFHRLYKKVGLEGCSSHSGRRTFVTQLAKAAAAGQGTLRDVQIAAGHARLDTTQRYIEPSGNLASMINLLGSSKSSQATHFEHRPERVVASPAGSSRKQYRTDRSPELAPPRYISLENKERRI